MNQQVANKIQVSKIIKLTGIKPDNLSEVITNITLLCSKFSISVDDIEMASFDNFSSYAMISSKFFPDANHPFWQSLTGIAESFNIVFDVKCEEDK